MRRNSSLQSLNKRVPPSCMSEQILNKRQKKMEVLLPEAGMIETKMKQGLSTPAVEVCGRQEHFVSGKNVLFRARTFCSKCTLLTRIQP